MKVILVRAILGTAFFVALVIGAEWVMAVFGAVLPPAVVAMIVLAAVLAVIRKVPAVLEEGAAFLFRIFPLLFIPAIIGVVTVLDIVAAHWLILIFAVTGSSLFGLLVSAILYRWLRAKKRSSL